MDNRISHEIHEAGLQPDRWPAVMARISNRFGGAVFLCQAFKSWPNGGEAWAHDYDLETFRTAPARLWTEEANPVVAQVLRGRLGVPIDRRSFFDDAAVDRHPVGRHFLHSQRLFHALLAVAQRDAETASQIFIARGRHAPEFGARDLASFGRISVDIGRAMRMHRALGRLGSQTATLSTMLDGIAQAVVLADGNLRILHANTAAERLLEAGDGLRRFRGAIRLHGIAAQRQLEAAAQALSARSPAFADTAIRAPRPSQAAAFRLCVFPAVGDATSAIAPTARAVILIHDPESTLDALAPMRLEAHYGLTAAEARTAALAGRALPAVAIARQLSTSPNTVKTQLKAVFGKLGVTTQAELVRLLMSRYPPIRG